MSDFSTTATLELEVPTGELRSARQQIEDSVGTVAVGGGTGGGSARRAIEGSGGAGGRRSRRMFRWARQRTSMMETSIELLESIEDKVGSGGGGALGGALGGLGLRSVFAGGAGAVGGLSLSALVQKVPLQSLLKRAPAFASLVTAADLGADLVTGSLTAEDVFEAPIELGQMVTFGALDNAALEGAIGTATLTIGAVQIAGGLGSLLPSVGLGTILTGMSAASMAKLLGTVGIGTILGKMTGDMLEEKLGTTGLGNALAPIGGGAALAAMLGTVSIGAIVGGTLGTVTVGTLLIDQMITKGVNQEEYPQQGESGGGRQTHAPRDIGPDVDIPDDVQTGGPSGLPDSTEVGGTTQGGAQQPQTALQVEAQSNPNYDITVTNDGQEIIEEVRREREKELDDLRREIERSLPTNR